MLNQKNNQISEYGLIGLEDERDYLQNYKFKSIYVKKDVYKELEAFAKTDSGKDVLGFSGNGKFLQAKNYVGIIQTISGFTLEILPKIYQNDDNEDNSKEIFLKLLEILYKLPNYKHTNSAKFDTLDKPLLEIFITMFLEEVGKIIKRGLKSDYLNKEENEFFLKGKLLFNEHIKRNYIHKERFYVAYDEYTQNRVENRLLKSTLKYLLNISSSFENIRLIRIYQEYMNSITLSMNYNNDFRMSNTRTRGMKYYKDALIWAEIFLKKETFSSFSGDTIAFALLYPMEKLFENYVEYYLINNENKSHQIIPQSSRKFVKDLFNLKPDFLIKKDDEIFVVADAKWKIIDVENKTFSQSDFYQLFAYSKVFKPGNKDENIALRLYYPMNENFNEEKCYQYWDETKITVIPLDLNVLAES